MSAPLSEPACHLCMLDPVCAARAGRAAAPIQPRQRNLRAGDPLYRQERPALAAFALRAGAAKLVYRAASGRDQVIDYALAGDVLGIGLCPDSATQYAESATALQPSVVCEVPVEALRSALAHGAVHAAMRAAVQRADQRRRTQLVSLGSLSGPQRLATLLLDLQAEHARRGLPAPITLPLSRTDIASYIGVTLETVSRLVTRFASAGLIQVQQRFVRIIDPAGLQWLLAGDGDSPRIAVPLASPMAGEDVTA